MKLLALVFLVGFALAAAVPVPSHDLSLKEDDLESMLVLGADDDSTDNQVAKELRDKFNQIMEQVKDAIEKGKGFKIDMIKQLKEIRQKMRDLKVDLGEKAKEALKDALVKAKDYWKKILDKLTGNDGEAVMMSDDDGDKTKLDKLKKSFEDILQQLKDAVDNGKTVREDTLQKLKEIRDKLKDVKVNVKEEFKKGLNELMEKAKDYWKKILEKLTGNDSGMHAEALMMANDDDIKTELGKKLKEKLEEILTKLKDAVDHGKGVKEEYLERLKEIREKLKEMKEDFGDKAREILEKIREKAKDSLKKILDRLGLGQQYSEMHGESFMMLDDDDIKTELGKKLQERFEEILEKIKEAVENGKAVKEETLEKLKDIRQKLRDLKLDMGDQAKKILEKMKEKVGDYWKKILDRLGLDKQATDMHAETNGMEADEDIKTELGKKLKKHLDEILEKIREAIEHGKTVKEEHLEKMKEIREQLRDLGVDIGKKAKELLKDLKDKGKEFWQKILERFGLDKQATDMHAETNGMEADVLEMEQRSFVALKEKLRILRDKVLENLDADKIKAKIEELFGKGTDFAAQLINKLKDRGHGHKQKLLEYIDSIYEGRVQKSSIKDAFEKIKTYFRERQIELKEKFVKFGEFVKDKYAEVLGKGKDKTENLKELARKFIDDARNIGKDVAKQAQEFFEEYREDLGTIYEDVRQKITEILKKKSE